MAWKMMEDGWESRVRRGDGVTDYRRLVSDSGKPHYQGAAKRYIEVYALPGGRVSAKFSSGFVRFYDSVEEAKENVR